MLYLVEFQVKGIFKQSMSQIVKQNESHLQWIIASLEKTVGAAGHDPRRFIHREAADPCAERGEAYRVELRPAGDLEAVEGGSFDRFRCGLFAQL